MVSCSPQLSAAECMFHMQVRVKRRGDDKKFLARVLAIGTECDLALLTVDDESFWKGLEPMHLGEMPSLQESVAVVGYPVGGDTISVTAGVVSRIEVRPVYLQIFWVYVFACFMEALLLKTRLLWGVVAEDAIVKTSALVQGGWWCR